MPQNEVAEAERLHDLAEYVNHFFVHVAKSSAARSCMGALPADFLAAPTATQDKPQPSGGQPLHKSHLCVHGKASRQSENPRKG